MTASTATPPTAPAAPPDPVNVLKAFASLRRLLGTYPSGSAPAGVRASGADAVMSVMGYPVPSQAVVSRRKPFRARH